MWNCDKCSGTWMGFFFWRTSVLPYRIIPPLLQIRIPRITQGMDSGLLEAAGQVWNKH
jgi:hypothetical protein